MTITDDQLSRAVTSAAEAIEVPEWDGLDVRAETALWHRRSTRWVVGSAAGVAAIVGMFALASSTPTERNNSSPAQAVERPSADLPDNQPQRGSELSAGQGSSSYGLPSVTSATTPLGSVRAPAGGAVGAGTTGGAGAAPDSARIVKTGSISLTVDDGKVSSAMAKLRAVAKQAHGYLSDEQTQNVGSSPSGTVTMRVPVGAFESVVAQISSKGFGAKVVSVESSGTDVTAEYADTAAQIASLKAARSRYLTILNAAKTVAEILSVQQRVDDVQGQIDQLEGNRRVLANQSDLATLTVSVNQKASQVLIRSERSGWSKAWHDSTHGFTSGIQSMVAHSGRALLVLLVAIACIALGRGGWRVARRRLI